MRFLLDHDIPDDIIYSLETLGHEALRLRECMATNAGDEEVLCFAAERGCILLTCNRDDFLELARRIPHVGIIILIRRRSRALERASLIRLLDRAGESGLKDNVTFA